MGPPFPSSPRAWLWRYLLALVLASALTAGGLVGGSWYLGHKFNRAADVAVELDKLLPGAANFLVLGSDSRSFVSDEAERESFGTTRDVGGQRADAIFIARVEPRSRRGLLVSFPRDLRVRHPGRKGLHRINEAFERGPQGVVDVIKTNFDIPVHHYLELDFAGFRRMVDAIGGVRMYVPSPVRDRKSGLDIPTPGCVVLDGRQSLAWVRSRNFTYLEAGKWRTDPTGDLGRIERQQEFIRRLITQAARQVALNPIRANRLADAALANLKVDSSLRIRDALRLVQALRAVGPAAVEMLAVPTSAVSYGLRLRPEAEPILDRLRGEGGEPSAASGPPVAPADVRVRVLNGTGAAGLAGDTSARLAEAGFTPAGAGDADRFSYRKTEIRYLPRSQAKAGLVARYLKGVGRLIPDSGLGNLDVVVVVGQDFKGITDRPGSARPAPGPGSTTTAPPPTTTASPAAIPPTPSGAPAQPAC